MGAHAPAINAHGIGEYLCGHNVLKAHALVYRLYKQKYYSEQQGKISISLNSEFFFSKINSKSVVDRAMQFGVKDKS